MSIWVLEVSVHATQVPGGQQSTLGDKKSLDEVQWSQVVHLVQEVTRT